MLPAQRRSNENETAADKLRRKIRSLEPLHTSLEKAVSERYDRGAGAGGRAIPVAAAVHDFLYHADHNGNPGLVPSVLVMADVTRLAFDELGDVPTHCDLVRAARQRHTNDPRGYTDAVPLAVGYLSAQADRILAAQSWTERATGELLTLWDQTASRIDVTRVRLDWEQGIKAAHRRLADLLTEPATDLDQLEEQCDEAEACGRVIAEEYVAYEGRLYEAIENRYLAGTSAEGWARYVTAEVTRLTSSALTFLGLTEHSTAALASCPWCSSPISLSRFDADLAVCGGCGRTWTISDGEAERHFTAWRQAGWTPTRLGAA